jgi:hypothetical protein
VRRWGLRRRWSHGVMVNRDTLGLGPSVGREWLSTRGCRYLDVTLAHANRYRIRPVTEGLGPMAHRPRVRIFIQQLGRQSCHAGALGGARAGIVTRRGRGRPETADAVGDDKPQRCDRRHVCELWRACAAAGQIANAQWRVADFMSAAEHTPQQAVLAPLPLARRHSGSEVRGVALECSPPRIVALACPPKESTLG